MAKKKAIYPTPFCNILGESKPLLTVLNLIEKAAPTNATVLISGESGTGKELVARAIHWNSSRSNKAFVAANCSAIPATLRESELFGHEKGTFTGAYTQKLGKFEIAHEGTLFLDEIGDMALPVQAKILRVLQEKEFHRLGGNRTIRVDVRIIAATNRDLKAGVKAGWFREDLYYRLNVLPIRVPTLRDRPGDIPLLIEHFLERFAAENGKGRMMLSAEAVRALQKYPFSGNVRELQNIIQRAVIFAGGPWIGVSDLPDEVRKSSEVTGQICSASRVRSVVLAKALQNSKVYTENGHERYWYKRLRCIKIDDIRRFLINQGDQWFSRKEFAKFLRNNAKSDTDKYKTAGNYLKILKENNICIHNGKKANKSKHKLAGRFLTTAQSR